MQLCRIFNDISLKELLILAILFLGKIEVRLQFWIALPGTDRTL